MPEMTPMMRQYIEEKAKHPDCLLFFRLGDFYEMFFEDAKTASKELELVLTGKDCGMEERAPMCGVPYHSSEAYIARLVEKGYKIAICEQMEDPALAKGLVKREVTRVITPGTVIESSMLDEGRNNYLAALYADDAMAGVGLCFADVSTGALYATYVDGDDVQQRVLGEMTRFSPREVLANAACFVYKEWVAVLTQRLGIKPQPYEEILFDEALVAAQFPGRTVEPALLRRAVCGVLSYLKATSGAQRITGIDVYTGAQFMQLDTTAQSNLELLETMRGGHKRGALLGVLDETKTAMGKRLLRSWLTQPLLRPEAIVRRHTAVGALAADTRLRGDVREGLEEVSDLERILTRIVYGSANAKELRVLAQTLRSLPGIRGRVADGTGEMLGEIYNNLDTLDDVAALIEAAIVDDPPLAVREGGMIRAGYDPEIDQLNFEMSDGRGVIARVEAQEKERTGIKNLKVGYNRVFGYYIELSRLYADQVPAEYIRKQTLANCERYITQELKELEARVLGARDRVQALEYEAFVRVREQVAKTAGRIQMTAAALAQLDVLASLAQVAVERQYVCPQMGADGVIDIEGGRHPVVETVLGAPFVPNDTYLDMGDNRLALITGPNMAGKSTYMRQTALIVLLAQVGSFVPAQRAVIGVVDHIFTRVGASDDLAAGQSTFMVEMSEVAHILRHATKGSLLIFDEIGRGTSTFDGMSIARAVLEYVAGESLGAKTMFATHYHELTALEDEIAGVKNYNIAAKKRGDNITFLRRIVRGPADDSYGIEVAKLAGIPEAVVARAKQVLGELEKGEGSGARGTRGAGGDAQQVSWADTTGAAVVERLRAMDVDTLTPIEAMQTLYEMKKEVGK